MMTAAAPIARYMVAMGCAFVLQVCNFANYRRLYGKLISNARLDHLHGIVH